MRRLIYLLPLVLLAWATATAAAAETAELIQALANSDPAVAAAACDDLGEMGQAAKEAVPALSKALGNNDIKVRQCAARALGMIGPAAKSSAPQLMAALKDGDALVRAQAANALGDLDLETGDVYSALAAMIVDKDPVVRREAIRSLERLDPPPDLVLPLMTQVLSDADAQVVMPALHSLAELGPKAVPPMTKALASPKTRFWALVVLGEVGPDAKSAVPAITPLLNDKTQAPDVRMHAALTMGEILSNIGKGDLTADDVKAGKELVLALDAKDASENPLSLVQWAAAFSLGRMAVHSEAANKGLQKLAQSNDELQRMVATWALARTNPSDPQLQKQAVDLLVVAIKSEDANVQSLAARSLAALDASPEVVAPALTEALKDADPEVVESAAVAFASLDPQVVVPQASRQLGNKELRNLAAQVLRLQGPKAKAAVPALTAALQSGADDVDFQREVLFALGSIGPDSSAALDEVVKLVASDNPQLANAAVYTLGKMGVAAKSAVPAIQKRLSADDQWGPVAASWAMVQIQPTDPQVAAMAVPQLIKALSYPHKLVQLEAVRALGSIGPAAKSASPALQAMLEDDDQPVRDAAAEALKKIGG